MYFYAVKIGRKPGIYSSWENCEEQIKDYPKAQYSVFEDESAALAYLRGDGNEQIPLNGISTTNDLSKVMDADNRKARERGHDEAFSSISAPTDVTITSPVDKGRETVATNTNVTVTNTDKSHEIAKTPTDNSHETVTTATDKGCEIVPTLTDNDHITVYTDGSFRKDDDGTAKAGIGVYIDLIQPMELSEPLRGVMDNNLVELRAAIRAIEVIKTFSHVPKSVTLCSDSQFVIDGMTNWVSNRNSPDNSKISKPDETHASFDRLGFLSEGLNVTWTKVQAHSNLPGNDAADRLARAALDL